MTVTTFVVKDRKGVQAALRRERAAWRLTANIRAGGGKEDQAKIDVKLYYLPFFLCVVTKK